MQGQQYQQLQAGKEVENILSSHKPKNLVEGVTRGVGNILGGAIGGVGILVLSPTAGLAMGSQAGGILGAMVGLVGGTLMGVVGSVAMVLGGNQMILCNHFFLLHDIKTCNHPAPQQVNLTYIILLILLMLLILFL